jgi:aminopeptidase N
LSYSYLTPAGLKTGKLVLSDSSAVVDLGTEVSWILPNSDQGGYFRWHIPTNMLQALGQDAVDHLNVRERMGLQSNMWALLSTEEISGEDFLAALAGLSSDSDPSVIDALLNQLESVRTTFITPDLRPEFASYVQAVLKPTFDRIGAQAIPDESVAQGSVRPDVLIWLAVDGQDEAAQAITAELTRAYLADEIPASGIVTNALKAEAYYSDQELFDQILARLESAKSPGDVQRYISVLGSFRDPEIVEQVLNYMLTGKVQPVDMGTLARLLAMYPDNRELLLEWFMNHDAELRELVPAEGMGLMVRIPDMLGVCSPDIVPTIIEFYGAPERSNSRMDQELKDVEAEVMECWELQQREIGSVGGYLSSHTQ